MGAIEKRGKNSYRLIAYVGKDENGKKIYEKKTVKAPTKKLAEKLLIEFENSILNGSYVTPSTMKLKDFLENEWTKKYAEQELSKTTMQDYIQDINKRLIPKYGHYKIGTIKTIHMLNLMNDIKSEISKQTGKKLSASTVRNHHNAFTNLFDRAVEWGFIKENPMSNLKRPTVKLKKAEAYTPAEMDKILMLLDAEDMDFKIKVRYHLAFVTGSRAGEVAAFEVSHVDFERGGIWRVQNRQAIRGQGTLTKESTKNDQDSFIMLPEYVIDMLKELIQQIDDERDVVGDMWVGGDNDFLFRSPIGVGYSPHSIGNHWRRFQKRHQDEIRYLSFHKFRHSSASYLISLGRHPKIIQQLLGHKDIRTTMNIYAHVFDEQKEETASSFNRYKPEEK